MKKSFYEMKIGKNGIPYLAEDGRSYSVDARKLYDNPDRVYDLAKAIGSTDDAEESVYMLCLDTRNKAVAVFLVTKGTQNLSLISPREVFQRALMAGAAGIIIWHNHPSGDTSPSKEDIVATEKLVAAGNVMGIPLLDHIIVGKEGHTINASGYTSLFETSPSLFKS